MNRYVVDFQEVGQAQVALVGGKGANLGELSRIEGIRVPPGFCVTTDAFQREDVVIPGDVAAAIAQALARHGEHAAYAVRSSATAEDSPAASFAGQFDSWLNVVGTAAILEQVRICWASLNSERAKAYCARNGIDHKRVRMAVVVQRMVDARASGILFTADPVTGNRKNPKVEAVAGLGESLVSGHVNADPAVLTEQQLVRLKERGRRIEAHFGKPQDIEWCLADGDFHIVQSRPITTLFPIPAAADQENHVYVSVGHQQMMTDPFKPLGLSFWQMATPRPMGEAAGRLFVDVTQMLASPASRANLIRALGTSDPLIGDALETIVERGFVPSRPDEGPAWTPPGGGSASLETDPLIPAELIEKSQASIAALKRDIRTKSGPALPDFILADMQEHKRRLFDPRSMQVIMAAIEAAGWLNDHMNTWLDEKNAADTLTRSVPGNVTSEMGLALLDVADVMRSYPDGPEAKDAIQAWLDKYGMRGVGEIDITRPRWSEDPTMLEPILQSHIENFGPGEAKRRFEQGLEEAREKEEELLERLRALPDGERKADETKRMIERVRTFAGYREYPKYDKICREFVYKQALMDEAERLVQAGVLREKEDIFYLRFEELHDVVRTHRVDDQLIRRRKDEFISYRSLTPPRVLTSEGEGLGGAYRRGDVPKGALAGLAVSAGTGEGRARVILDIASADLEPGDILVTAYTDPSWTPLFVAIKGLVTEVGGLMTHGAVIAREYGLPAVVGVEHATQLIRDGQRIRVHGTEGYVEILP